jgi:hypothetical protein
MVRDTGARRHSAAIGELDVSRWLGNVWPMPSVYDDPEHWRERADEARATATYAADPIVKAAMLRVAEEYDRLVRHTQDKDHTPDQGDSPEQEKCGDLDPSGRQTVG